MSETVFTIREHGADESVRHTEITERITRDCIYPVEEGLRVPIYMNVAWWLTTGAGGIGELFDGKRLTDRCVFEMSYGRLRPDGAVLIHDKDLWRWGFNEYNEHKGVPDCEKFPSCRTVRTLAEFIEESGLPDGHEFRVWVIDTDTARRRYVGTLIKLPPMSRAKRLFYRFIDAIFG